MNQKRRLKKPWWKGQKGKGKTLRKGGGRKSRQTIWTSTGQGRTAQETGTITTLNGPEALSVGVAYDETAQFVNEILCLRGRKVRTRLNLEKTNKVDLGGILLFAAALHIINLAEKTSREGVRWKVVAPQNIQEGINGILHDFGVDELIDDRQLRQDRRKRSTAASLGIVVAKVRMGRETNAQVVRKFVEDQLQDLIKRAGGMGNKIQLIRAVTEAITNVREHAYGPETIGHYWWLAGAYAKENNRLIVAVYDGGRGIATTMRNRYAQRLQQTPGGRSALQRIRGLRDEDIVALAHRPNRSRTKQAHRGKGLQWDMQGYLKHMPGEGQYRVTSGRGKYVVSRDETGEEIITRGGVATELRGTLVEWELELAQVQRT